MGNDHVLAIVLAGGKGSRMDVLTDRRAKPTLPFGGVYSLLDICLSNVVNSGLDDVWVVVQYHASTFDEVLAHGRPWDLDRFRGGLRVIPPQQGIGDEEDGMATGNADALFRIREMIAAAGAREVLVLSADHVYSLDHREVLATHRDRGAECTVVTTTIGLGEAGHHTLVDVDADGRVTGVHHKPDDPQHEVIASEVFCYDAAVLVEVLERLHAELSGQAGEGDTGLGDFSEHLLPGLVDRGKVVAHALPGYWRDLGRPSAYLRAHQDLLAGDLDVLHDPSWPVRTASSQGPAARIHAGAEVHDAMLGDRVEVRGRVERSVLGPGVVVEDGAVVHDAVLMRDVRVAAGARVGWSIVDAGTVVAAGARVGAADDPSGDERLLSEEVTILGQDVVVGAGAIVSAGSRVSAGTDLPPAV